MELALKQANKSNNKEKDNLSDVNRRINLKEYNKKTKRLRKTAVKPKETKTATVAHLVIIKPSVGRKKHKETNNIIRTPYHTH